MSQYSDEHLPGYRVRPRFRVETSMTCAQLVEQLENNLKRENAGCLGRVHSLGGTLSVPLDQQHYWSPQLSLSFEETDQGTTIRGLYGPRPAVWGMFVFFYSVIGIGTLIVATIGFSKLSLGKPSGLLWLVPVLLLVFLSLYLVSYFGQKIGKKQMIILHRFFEASTGLNTNQ